MMPHSTIQRDFHRARNPRPADVPETKAIDPRSDCESAPVRRGVRVRVGHALIGAGRWLSGEGVDVSLPSTPHRAT